MNDRECAGRLIASTTHELRNVLAVLRETSGLAQDLLACGTAAAREKLPATLRETGRSVERIAALADSLDGLAQGAAGRREPCCDVGAVARAFCRMMARAGKACGIMFDETASSAPSVPAPLEAFDAHLALMNVFDVCAAAGGGVALALTAEVRHAMCGLLLEALPLQGA